MMPIMSKEEAEALAAEIRQAPGWQAHAWERAHGHEQGVWDVLADHDGRDYFLLRSRHEWERMRALLAEADQNP
jgi:hypothetical protein